MGLFSSGLLAGAGGLLGKGGDKARAGHMVEVVLNGRVTLYTVYKRPFVDYFLRKVCRRSDPGLVCLREVLLGAHLFFFLTGLWVVHPRRFHCFHAGIR